MDWKDFLLPGFSMAILIAGLYYAMQYPGLPAPILMAGAGGALALLPWLMLWEKVQRSGLAPMVEELGPKDVLVFWIGGTKKVHPVKGREMVYQDYIVLPFPGRIKITKGSVYTLPTGRKVFFASPRSDYTIPVEQAKVARELKELGFRNFAEVAVFAANYPYFVRWLSDLTEEEKEVIKQRGLEFLQMEAAEAAQKKATGGTEK